MPDSKKLFLTPPELVSHVLDIIPDISEYKIIEINPKKKLQEILVDAGLFTTATEAKKAGYKGYPEAAISRYQINEIVVVILV